MRTIFFITVISALSAQVVQTSQVPQNYAATTTTSTFTAQTTIPALPSLGAANSIFKDPSFGSRILRVTDGSTLTPVLAGAFTNYSVSTPSSSESSIWRKDGLMFYLGTQATDAQLLFSFNPSTFQATLASTSLFHMGGAAEFSFQHNDKLYGAGPSGAYTISKCDPTALCASISTVFDFGSAVGISTGTIGDASVSATEIIAVPTNGSAQDNWVDVIAYCVETTTICTAGQFAVLDYTQGLRGFGSGSYTGQSTGSAWNPAWKIHNARIGKEGRYISITTQGSGAPYQVIWDLQAMTTGYISTTNAGGHKAQGYNVLYSPGPIVGQGNNGPSLVLNNLSAPNSPINLLPINGAGSSIGGVSDYQSAQNADPNYSVPVFGSTTEAGVAGVSQHLALGKIIAAETDQVRSTVWQFADTRSSFGGAGGYPAPLYTSAVSVHSGGGGSGYATNDTGTITGCNGSITPYAIYHVSSVSGGAVTALTITYGGGYYLAPSSACATTRTTGAGSGLTVDISSTLWQTFIFTTRGSVSQDGKYFMFTSAWEGTLGADAEMLGAPNLRTDVFVVELTPLTPQFGGTVAPGSTLAVFNTLAPDMQSCTATVYSDAARTMSVTSASDTVRNGRTSQILVSGLSASTNYWGKVACEGGNTTLLNSFLTRASGSGTYSFSFAYSASQTVKYCTNAAMTTGCSTLGASAAPIVPVASNTAIYASVLVGTTPVDVKVLVAP